ncbi:hypothetical protein PACTADRAFT_51822 [Pachysolen tannophilus NRRL Y-2460]|uniref:ER membrane protein complex subunit 5 n=1 Tax=Pachysolen tannophilus NRRL Y-2460 TaxID=669874 RepID=A0A1E4TN69_PACTA|nr:hypothetical protein PACTADRAFT_51822 [Pachysolen tannophilus NRRL Y-2460]
MSLKSTILYVLGIFFMLHSAYSAFSFNQYLKASLSLNKPTLPNDIKFELILSAILIVYATFENVLFNTGNVYNYEIVTGEKKPVTKKLKLNSIYMNQITAEDEKLGKCVFDELENRSCYMDVAERRAEFEKWFNNQ